MRLQFVGGKLVAFAGDAIDLAGVNGDASFFRAVVALGAGRDLDAVFQQMKGSEFGLVIFLGVSGAAQEGGDFFGVGFVAIVHRAGQGVNFRRIAEDRRLEALRNDAVVLDVEVAENTAEPDGHDEEDEKSGADDGVARKSAPLFAVACRFEES